MSDELKPVRCGCGGKPYIYHLDAKDDYPWTIMCEQCEIVTANYATEAEAITAWNRAMGATDTNVGDKERTAKVETYTDDQQETWSVCECGTDVWKSYNYCPECGAKLDWSDDE